MTRVKTFRIHPDTGVPDKDIRCFLDLAEKEIGILSVTTTHIPETFITVERKDGVKERVQKADARLTVIVTKLDDHR